MKSFGEWFAEQAPIQVEPEEAELPDGLYMTNGRLQATCLSCEKMYDWEGTADEFESGHYANVCGGSPWCLP